jgi:nucleoside-diphosphate-sugar epimerase
MKKIFLLGSTGFIGKNLYEALKNKYSINNYTRGDNLYKSLENFNPDIIINSAGEISEISKMFDSNIGLTFDILNFCKHKEGKVKYIHMGTSKEYGDVKYKIKENDPLNPRDIYETTKSCGSLLCKGYAKYYKLPIIVVKLFSIYGKYQHQNSFISKLIDSCKNNKEIQVFNGINDFLYIKDLISAIKILSDVNNKKIIGGDLINLCSGKSYSNKEVVKIVSKIFEKKIKVKYINQSIDKNRKPFSLGDPSYAREKYGFKSAFDLNDGIIDLKKNT